MSTTLNPDYEASNGAPYKDKESWIKSKGVLCAKI